MHTDRRRSVRFITIRDLRANTARLRKDLEDEHEVVVTANGRPFAIMTRVSGDDVEAEVKAIRNARAQAAVSRIRARARAEGTDQLSTEEIDAVVATSRRETRAQR